MYDFEDTDLAVEEWLTMEDAIAPSPCESDPWA